MKKILYIIPVFLLSVILVNNVYGVTTYVDTIDDLYTLAEEDRVSLGSKDWSIMWSGVDFDYTDLINSGTFQNKLQSYNYYTIFANYVGDKSIYLLFSNEIPTLTLYRDDNFFYKYSFDGISDYNFTSFSATSKTEYDVSKISSSTWYSNTSTCDGSLLKLYSTSTTAYKYILKDDFINNICTNYDLKYTNTDSSVIQKDPEFEFIPNYNSDYTLCNLKVNVINAPNIYTLRYVLPNADEFYDYDNTNGININYNSYVKLLLFDDNETIILTQNYIESNLVSNFPSEYFEVDFDNSDKDILAFTPMMYNNVNDTYECYFSFSADNDNLLFRDNNNFFLRPLTGINNLDWTLLENSHTYYIYVLTGKCKVDLNFKIVNKTTGNIELQRSFTFDLSVTKGAQAVSSSTNGTQDKFFNSGGNNLDISQSNINNPFSSLDSNSSFEDIGNVASETFTTFSALFSILPGFIWAFIAGTLTILVVLRVLGR